MVARFVVGLVALAVAAPALLAMALLAAIA